MLADLLAHGIDPVHLHGAPVVVVTAGRGQAAPARQDARPNDCPLVDGVAQIDIQEVARSCHPDGGEAGHQRAVRSRHRSQGCEANRVALAVRLEVAASEVDVRVDQAGQQRPPTQIDDGDIRIVSARLQHSRCADSLNAATVREQRASLSDAAVAIYDCPVEEQRLHGASLPGASRPVRRPAGRQAQIMRFKTADRDVSTRGPALCFWLMLEERHRMLSLLSRHKAMTDELTTGCHMTAV